MSEIGHNGGPPLQKLTSKKKIERIKEVLEMDNITAAQKCIGVGIICEADADWITPELSTADLQRYASVKDRETVYRATKKLAEHKVVNPIREEGKPNRYAILTEAIDAAIDEIDANSTGRVSSEPPTPTKPDGIADAVPVGSNPTGRPEAVGPNPTTRVEPDGGLQTAKSPRSITTRATNESPTEIVITKTSPNGEGEWTHTPHMNGVGFVIDERRGAVIPAVVVDRWRAKFTDIPDLEAAMQNLSCNMLSNLSHKGWSCPEGWMVSILASMNQEAKDKKRIAEAKVARTQKGDLPAWKTDINDKLARMRAANK